MPKTRIAEINKKLNNTPSSQQPDQEFAKTMAPPKKSGTLADEAAPIEDEFSKTLVPAQHVLPVQPSNFYQTLTRLIV